MIKRSFFRKVGFGIGPGQAVPEDPLAWAQAQVEKVPALSWKGDIPTGAALFDNYAEWVYQDRKVLRERHKTDRRAYRAAKDALRQKVGERFHENLELAIRHDAAINSGAPVFERLWWFWCNHFAITEKDFMPEFTTGPYHREIIRTRLCGSFAELATAVTTSWAMIHNLDNSESVGPNSKWGQNRRKRGQPATVNENHARELLEIHTVSPAAGYGQDDVIALSYVMAGWEHPHSKTRLECNPVKFNQKKHEPGDHKVLGKTYKQRGITPENKLLDALKDLSAHPSTREFIAFKLCRHFITDHPSEAMMLPIIDAWANSNGHLPKVHAALLKVAYDHADRTEKFQNPEVWLMQMVNMTGAAWPPAPQHMNYDNVKGPTKVQRAPSGWMREIGLSPYRPKQPNGWPDTMPEWVSSELLIRRLAFSQKLTSSRFFNRDLSLDAMVRANFDDADAVRAFLNLDGDAMGTPRKIDAVQQLFPSRWMLLA